MWGRGNRNTGSRISVMEDMRMINGAAKTGCQLVYAATCRFCNVDRWHEMRLRRPSGPEYLDCTMKVIGWSAIEL